MEHAAEVIAICTDEYLRYIRALRYALKDLEQEIEDMEQTLILSGVKYSDMGGGGYVTDKVGDGVAKLLEMREKLAAEQVAHADELAHARNLCRFSEPRQALWLSRVERKSYKQIAAQLGYSVMTIRRMIPRGRRELYSVMPEQFRRQTIPNAIPYNVL